MQRCTLSHSNENCKAVACWDSHVPVYNHRESWAEEHIAPSTEKEIEQKEKTSTPSPAKKGTNMSSDILIVASKLKAYIKERAGMSTSANVMPKLSETVRELCDKAIENARNEGRKTVMDRDFI